MLSKNIFTVFLLLLLTNVASAQVNGTLTPSSIVGTATNDNAPALSIGEYVSSNVGNTSISTVTQTDLTSISLTAGDWDVEGTITYVADATTIPVYLVASINTVSATNAASGRLGRTDKGETSGTGSTISLPTGRKRISLAATTTVYLVAYAQFSVSTMIAIGEIAARRVR